MNRAIEDVFRFCPICGVEATETGKVPFVCQSCAYHHFFSPATAVGALIADEKGRLLFIERAKEPGKGMLGLPGGFVDAGESAETAARREVKEEVGLAAEELFYLTSYPNTYLYRGIATQVIDIFFVCLVKSLNDLAIQEKEVSGFRFATPNEAIYEQMAFESNRRAVQLFTELYSGKMPEKL